MEESWPSAVSPLTLAVREKNLPEVKRLLVARADPNVRDDIGEPPLFDAVCAGEFHLAVQLLLFNADPDLESGLGMVVEDLAEDLTSDSSMYTLLALFQGKHMEAEVEEAVLDKLDDDTRKAMPKHLMKSKIMRAKGKKPCRTKAVTLPEGAMDVSATLLMHSADPDWRSLSQETPMDRAVDPPIRALLQLFSNATDLDEADKALAGLSDPLRQDVQWYLAPKVASVPTLVIGVQDEDLKQVGLSLEGCADPCVDATDVAVSTPKLAPMMRAAVPEDWVLTDAQAPGLAEKRPLPGAPARPTAEVQPWEPALEPGTVPDERQLPLAVRAGDALEVMRLLEAFAHPDWTDKFGETLLFEAASHDCIDVAAALLLKKADPYHRSPVETTALDLAKGRPMVTLLQLFQGGQVDAAGRLALEEALSPYMWGELIQKELLDPMAPAPEAEGIFAAVQVGELSEVLCRLQAGADPNTCNPYGETPLFEAVLSDRLDTAAALLAYRADPLHRSHNDSTPISYVFPGSDEDRLDEMEATINVLSSTIRPMVIQHLQDASRQRMGLMTTGVENHVPGESPRPSKEDWLAKEVQLGTLDGVWSLLRDGADPDIVDADGETVLFKAADNGDPDIVALLLMHSADLCRVSPGGNTVKRYASEEICQLLDFFEGDTEQEGVMDLLSERVREAVVQHMQDRKAEATVGRGDASACVGLQALAPEPPAVERVTSSFQQRTISSPSTGRFQPDQAYWNGQAAEAASFKRPFAARRSQGEMNTNRAPELADPGSLGDLKRQLRLECVGLEAMEQRISALEAQVKTVETGIVQPPRRIAAGPVQDPHQEPDAAPWEGPGTGTAGRAAPAKPASASGHAKVERCQVVHSPCVAARSAPSMHGETVCRLPRGTVVELAEWNASREWRRIAEAPGSLSSGVNSWVPVFHRIAGTLLRPLDAPEGPTSPHCVSDWRAAVQAAYCNCSDGTGPLGGVPAPQFGAEQTGCLLTSVRKPGSFQAGGGSKRSAAVSALRGVLLGEASTADPAKCQALASLDPRTVRIVLSSCLKHLQASGASMQVRRAPAMA